MYISGLTGQRKLCLLATTAVQNPKIAFATSDRVFSSMLGHILDLLIG
ncbi:MAG TPA: hypothetical protein VK512_16605 [Xanthobacteraceae bacterium]|nr:hypothetical protein [Xanthobacteraceae bacterium]